MEIPVQGERKEDKANTAKIIHSLYNYMCVQPRLKTTVHYLKWRVQPPNNIQHTI